MLLRSLWTALWTPLDDKGNLLKDQLKSHLQFLLEKEMDGVVLCGSTGHFPYLSLSLKKELVNFVVEQIGPERVIVNISDINPSVVEDFARFISTTTVAAVMLFPPMYYSFAERDIAYYLVYMTKLAKRPLILYNFPECVRNRIEIETIEKVCSEIPIVGIKQSGADFAYHKPLVALGKQKNFSVFTGSDSRLFEALEMGVFGHIGGSANAIPDLIFDVYQGYKKKDVGLAKTATDKIKSFERLMESVSFPLNTAALMEARNLFPGSVKEVVSSETKQDYSNLVIKLRQCFAENGLKDCYIYGRKHK